jgi:hypothetical protein
MANKKEVKITSGGTNLYFTIFEALKSGLNPAKICLNLGISKQSLQYYLSSLKADFKIRKLGYGTWEVLTEDIQKRSKNQLTNRSAQLSKSLDKYKPDFVRGHAFCFTVTVPKDTRGWANRREILARQGIIFKVLANIYGGAERLIFKGKKVIFTNSSIIVYEPASFLASTSQDSKDLALASFKDFIASLENLIGANLGNYRFKVSRQHYALIKNALAMQYDREGNKLKVYEDGQLWFLIDKSLNINEAETVHPRTADIDNKVVQDFFNSLKRNPVTIDSILGLSNTTAGQLAEINKALAMLTVLSKQLMERLARLE